MTWPRCWIRNLIYLIALAALSPWLVYRAIKTGRYREGLRQKFFGLSLRDLTYRKTRVHVQSEWMGGLLEEPKEAEYELHCLTSPSKRKRAIWLHGVSVGEIQLLVPLAKRLASEFPEHRIAISTTTKSGMELARRLLSEYDLFYFPFDFSWAIRATIDSLQPSMIVLSELELWPNLIDVAHARDIPLTVVNGRLSERSCRGYLRFSRITRPMFAKLHLVAAQNEEYRQRFVQCGCDEDSVEVTGSVKFDNVNFDRNCSEADRLRSLAGITSDSRVVVVGSTQAEEELVAAEAYLQAKSRYPNAKLIVIPRHPDRFEDVFAKLTLLDCKVVRRSGLEDYVDQDEWDILLVDSVGELRYWWALAEVALVGGSFGARGGQNMLEPAAYGVNVAFGPNTANFRDIATRLLEDDAAIRLQGLDEIEPWLWQQLNDPGPGIERGKNAVRLIAEQQGALEKTVQVVKRQLATSKQVGSKAA